jgi:hypothetical protein
LQESQLVFNIQKGFYQLVLGELDAGVAEGAEILDCGLDNVALA